MSYDFSARSLRRVSQTVLYMIGNILFISQYSLYILAVVGSSSLRDFLILTTTQRSDLALANA